MVNTCDAWKFGFLVYFGLAFSRFLFGYCRDTPLRLKFYCYTLKYILDFPFTIVTLFLQAFFSISEPLPSTILLYSYYSPTTLSPYLRF